MQPRLGAKLREGMKEPGAKTPYPRAAAVDAPRRFLNAGRLIAIAALIYGGFVCVADGEWTGIGGIWLMGFPAWFFWWSNWRPLIAFVVTFPLLTGWVAIICDKGNRAKTFGEQMVHVWHEIYWIWIVLAIIQGLWLWRQETKTDSRSLDAL